MSYYWFNRQEILQKAKERYSKEKAAEYYLQNKETIKKLKKWIQKLAKRRKRQDQRVLKKNISATDSVQKINVTKEMSFVFTQYKNE